MSSIWKSSLPRNEENISLMDMAVGFIKSVSLLETAIIGVTTEQELTQITESWGSGRTKDLSKNGWDKWAVKDSSFLDPRCWTS